MMKKITLFLFVLLTVSIGYSQTDVIESFDGATVPTLQPDNGECTPIGMTVTTAQASTGTKSLEIIAQAAGNPWQGARLTLQGGGMNLTANKLVKVDVFSNVPAGILAKVTDGPGPDSASAKNHTGTGWETLTFNFTDKADGTTQDATGTYTNIRFYPLFGTTGGYAGQGTVPCVSNAPITIYIDNIIGTAPSAPTCSDGEKNGNETGVDCGGPDCAACPPTCSDGLQNGNETGVDCGGPDCAACPVPPTSAAPTPPARNPANVVSIFTPSYAADVPFSAIQAFAGGVYENFTVVNPNDTRRLSTPSPGGGYQIQFFDAAPPLNLTSFTHFHIDLWFENAGAEGSEFSIRLQNFVPGGGVKNAMFTNINVFNKGAGAWKPIDIELANFIDGAGEKDNIQQILFTAQGPVIGPTYISNIYFYKIPDLGADDFDKTSFSLYPNPTQSSWTVKTQNVVMSSIRVFDMLGKQVLSLSPNASETSIDGSNLKTGLYFAQISTATGISTLKLVKQ